MQARMTYGEALKAGYVDAEQSWERGYVSRVIDPLEQEVQVAGGTKKGRLYVLLPSMRSTKYCIRQYLRRREE